MTKILSNKFAQRRVSALIAAIVAVFVAAVLIFTLGSVSALADDESSNESEQTDSSFTTGEITVEGALANAQNAQDVAAENLAASQAPEISIEDDGHVGATSVDGNQNNVVDLSQAADNSFIYDTSIASLADEAAIYNNQTVQIAGEVVGDCIAADAGFNWITVEAEASNDSSSISCYISGQLASKIDTYGRYGVTGTRVQVRGEYHQACDNHEGLADIHVTTLEVSNTGYVYSDTFNLSEWVPGLFLILLGVVMIVVFNIVRERAR